MKRLLFTLLAVIIAMLLVALPLAGCKPEAEEAVEEVTEEAVEEVTEEVTEEAVEEVKEPVTLEYWAYGASSQHQEWLAKWTDIWMEANPNVTINITVQEWTNMFEHFQTAVATDTIPDIVKIHQPFINAFGEQAGVMIPFDDFEGFDEVKDTIVDGYMETCKFNGKYYGLPSTSFSFALVGNKAMFDEAGLELPKTWDEFRETAKALSGDGKYGIAIQGADLGGTAYRLVEWVFKAGGSVFNEDWTATELNTAPWIEAVKLFQGLLADGSLDPAFLADDFVSVGNKFANGIVAMDVEGFFWDGYINGLELGAEIIYGEMPSPDGGPLGTATPGTLGDGTVLGITNKCPDVEAAWDYIAFISSAESDLDALEMNAHNGLPITKEVTASDDFKTIPGWEAWEAEGPTVKGWPYHPAITEITRDVIAVNFLKALTGELTAEEAMYAADQETLVIMNR